MYVGCDQIVYIYEAKHVTAWAIEVEGEIPQFWLLAGSELVADNRCVPSCPPPAIEERSQMHKRNFVHENGQNLILEADWCFEPTKHKERYTGMTLAANVVGGNNESGPKMWKKDPVDSQRWLREQNLYGEWRRISLPQSGSELTLHVPPTQKTTTAEALAQFSQEAADAIENDDPPPIQRIADRTGVS